MIPGFNTDIEHGGVVYHVQTEDKGTSTPLILSLVYIGGTILAAKRTPYDDLLASGFDETKLAERLQRQHKLICAAIRAGRIEDLKKMSERPAATSANTDTPGVPVTNDSQQTAPGSTPHRAEPTPDVNLPETAQPTFVPAALTATPTVRVIREGVADFARTERIGGELSLQLLDEQPLIADAEFVLKAKLCRRQEATSTPLVNIPINVKVFGTEFRPESFAGLTGDDGIARIPVRLPLFTAGRAVLLVQAAVGGYEVELRRLIQHAS